jgi:signal transduction histidine kinase
MASPPKPEFLRNPSDRWSWVWGGALLILGMFGVGLSGTELNGRSLIEISSFLLGLIGWFIVSASHHLRIESRGKVWQLLYFGVGWSLWYAVAGYGMGFFFLLFVLFPYVYTRVSLPIAVTLSVGLTLLSYLRLEQFAPQYASTWMVILAVSLAAGGLLGYFIQDIVQQSEARKSLILTLMETQKQLAQAQHQAGILQERQRLAGELHDTVVQGLVSIVTHLEAAENTATHDPAQALYFHQQAKSAARQGLTDARRFIWAVQPLDTAQMPLRDQLKSEVDRWSAETGLRGEYRLSGDSFALPGELNHVLLRVTQEALANCQRHARASQVTVTLTYATPEVILDIHDNGRGFDPESSHQNANGGFGLINMRRRVDSAGGQLILESSPGEGSTVTAIFSVRASNGNPIVGGG